MIWHWDLLRLFLEYIEVCFQISCIVPTIHCTASDYSKISIDSLWLFTTETYFWMLFSVNRNIDESLRILFQFLLLFKNKKEWTSSSAIAPRKLKAGKQKKRQFSALLSVWVLRFGSKTLHLNMKTTKMTTEKD